MKFAVLLIVTIALALGACAQLPYYVQSANGQLDILSRRQNIDVLIADDSVDPALRERLGLVRSIRGFAVEALALPDTGSYTDYADLQRSYAVLSVFAAKEFSTELHTWCYPVIGCAAYRGYFDREHASEHAQRLQAQGYDTYIGPVPAYSTLGWFDDPILNTVLDWPDSRLAGLMFHELAHQQLYVPGDTVFNESFAVAVEQAGVVRWLSAQQADEALAAYRRGLEQRRRFVASIEQARHALSRLYQRSSLSDSAMREAKAEILQGLRERYAVPEDAQKSGYAAWFEAGLNNAKLGSVAAYHTHVNAFLALLDAHGGNFPSFYAHVARIGNLDKQARNDCLSRWRDAGAGGMPLAGSAAADDCRKLQLSSR